MSKILDATCENNEVTCEGKTITGAVILSEGVGQSSGLLLIEESKKTYVTSNASDLKTTIEKLTDALDKIATILTNIGAGMLGSATAPPPTLGADVSELQSISSELENLKDGLK